MASDADKMHYSDLISPDDSIKKLIEQLEALNSSYGELVTAVKNNAKDIVRTMKDMSASTAEGRAKLDDAAIAASRLERAEKELAFSMSDVGKQVAWLKAQTASQNKMTSEQQTRAQALAGSYDKLALQVKDLTRRWKELSAEERAGEKGDRILSQLMHKKQALADLDSQMKLQVQQLSAVEKAEKKLAFLMSDEGKRLIELKRQISDIVTGRNRDKQATDELVLAQKRLAEAQKSTNVQVQQLNAQTREANRVAKLTAQLNLSEEGSYNRLAAQYELNKIKLNAMSKAERENINVGGQLEQQTREIYQEMIRLQEATGNHRLSVGHYTKAWNGLSVATTQVIRELPAAAVGLNTFFLGISNNIPILVDEINKVREANKIAIAEGKPTTSVMKQITAAIFNWQTALVVLLTYLSMHGKELVEWCKKLYRGRNYVESLGEALWKVNDAMKTSNGDYGEHIAKVKLLAAEWKNLSSKKEQLQWIKDNQTEFRQLDIEVQNVTDAERAFVNHTDSMIQAFGLRARAAAAAKLAAEQYERAILLETGAKTEEESVRTGDSGSWLKGTVNYAKALWHKWTSGSDLSIETEMSLQHTRNAKSLREEAKAAEKTADQYIQLAESYRAQAKALMESVGISDYHKYGRTKHPRAGREPRDLTDTIYRNEIELRKKYEHSITMLQHDEYAKRRKEAMDSTMNEIAQLMEKYRKNEEYVANVDKKYKELTDSQRKQIEQQQKWILSTIANARLQLAFELEQIEKESQVNSVRIARDAINWKLEDIADSIREEQAIKLQQLKDEENLVKQTNATLTEGGRSQLEITNEYAKKRMQLIAEYDRKILSLREADVAAQLELVKKGSEQELDLLLRQNELAMQIALAENRMKPAAEQQSEEQIRRRFAKKATTITGSFRVTGFEEAQAVAQAQFDIVKHSESEITKFKLQQEKDRWAYQLSLAKSGALDWSDAQIKVAEATIMRIECEIKEANDVINLIGEKGLGVALLDKLGFNEKQINALSEAKDIILDNIKAIFDAEVQLAEKEVKLAEDRVAAMQKAYDAEVEARNNGYANNVATAKQELQLAKKTQAEKQKLLDAARRRQEAVDTAVQVSSLVTASANLWSSFSKVPIVGPALALAAIGAMWSSFAVAKVKAAQVARKSSQEYGEGGLEFLEGGSHASGNDIDLNTYNSRGKNMRAEGGEALAIINKKSTKRYRRQLPGIINSLNKGLFEEQYARAFEKSEVIQANILAANNSSVDLSNVERAIEAIRKQNEHKVVVLGDGTTVEIHKNVRRYYR